MDTHHEKLRLACAAALGALVLGACAAPGTTERKAAVNTTMRANLEPGLESLSSREVRDYRGMRASELMNRRVSSVNGEFLGQIRDLVVHMSTGEVRYAVLASAAGGTEGLYAVPVKLLRTSDDRGLTLDLERARMQAQRRWSAERWPDLHDRAFWGEVDRAAGAEPVQPTQAYHAYRASELIGKDIDNVEGRHLGSIADLVIDMNRGKVHYAVLQFEPHVKLASDELFAVPLHSIIFRDGNPQRAVLNIRHDRLARMAGFDASAWPALNDPHYLRSLDQMWLVVMPPDAGVGATR